MSEVRKPESKSFLPYRGKTVMFYKDCDPDSTGTIGMVTHIEADDPPVVTLSLLDMHSEKYRPNVRKVRHVCDPHLKTNPALRQYGAFDSCEIEEQRRQYRLWQETEHIKRSEIMRVERAAQLEKQRDEDLVEIAKLYNKNLTTSEIAQEMSSRGRLWQEPQIRGAIDTLRDEGKIKERKMARATVS